MFKAGNIIESFKTLKFSPRMKSGPRIFKKVSSVGRFLSVGTLRFRISGENECEFKNCCSQ